MKTKYLLLVMVILTLIIPSVVYAAGGIDDPGGVPLYVIIEVEWDGDPGKDGSWIVHGPLWEPTEEGPVLASCSMGPVGSCLEMNYDFTFHGKTVHFNEVGVDSVTYTPQIHHVVLHDKDGDGTYTGSLSASHYFPWRLEPDGSEAILYFDRIEYEVTFDQYGNVIDFHYLQYEHKKL